MNPLVIEAEDDITPAVTLDGGKNIFEITGWSHPEDAIAFYTPVLNWIGQYGNTPNPQTDLHFKFQYYNTASAKQIFRLISALEEVAKKGKVKIYWHYEEEDTDMLSAGERFSKMSTVPFSFVINKG